MTESPDVLPEPDERAIALSSALCDHMKTQCDSNLSMAFSKFMDLALYAPGMGYYSGGKQKFGESGDFVTAPEVSSLFSQCIARQVADVLADVTQPVILEIGAGSGVMAADILLALEQQDSLPDSYKILELSAELRERQQQTINDKAPHLLQCVTWIDTLDNESFRGVVLANEVLDAMPVECFRIAGSHVESLQVGFRRDEPVAEYQVASDESLNKVRVIEERLETVLPDGYCSEFNPAIPAWLESLHVILQQGLVLLIDYGYSVQEYYHQERCTGTLMCHYQHRAHTNPLWYPGLQDITAFVDFTDVAYAAQTAGFEVSGFTTQAMFLMGCGLAELHESLVTDDVRTQVELSQQIKTLTLPSEMGERFKVMGLTKFFDEPLRGFQLQDLRNRL